MGVAVAPMPDLPLRRGPAALSAAAGQDHNPMRRALDLNPLHAEVCLALSYLEDLLRDEAAVQVDVRDSLHVVRRQLALQFVPQLLETAHLSDRLVQCREILPDALCCSRPELIRQRLQLVVL